MSSKGKQLSVLIAGATGSTGSELVSRLVSHPDVARVVALSRQPITVNRWRTFFPRIHTGDALSCLSVVSVDWDKITADAAHIPSSYVQSGRWAGEARHLAGLRVPNAETARPKDEKTKSTKSPPTRAATGYVKVVGDPSVNVDARRQFLVELQQSAFYKSVFSGHHVAINCLGSKLFLRASVDLVDHQYSIAFAKMVRLFNCMAHAEPSEEAEELLAANSSERLDRILWEEVCAACYGDTKDTFHALGPSDAGRTRPSSETAATLQQYTQLSVMGSSTWSPLPYFRAHGQCDEELRRLFNRDDVSIARHARLRGGEEDAADDGDAKRAQTEMLLRRDVVRVWDKAHLTVWRPGLLRRSRPRLLERLLGFFLVAIDVRYFADIIVDDIIATVEDERGVCEIGSVKVIGANSVSVRVKMKRLEEDLNRRDLRVAAGGQEENKTS